MRFIAFSLLAFLFVSTSSLQGQQYETTYTTIPTFTDQEVQDRLSKITNYVVPPQFDRTVRSYIRTYAVKKRDRTEEMLGRTVIYFPLFERILMEHGLPQDLKYLSVVESALNANAVSRSGAVGLWQFMKPTAKENGLKINRYVDERKDPIKATNAAAKYLKKQFKRFGNWELALAAYNGGPGRVNRAIKRGRSKNFWRIRRHLPRETRAYVPAYIAATYIANYYHTHNLTPRYPDKRLQVTETIKVYQKVDFSEILDITGTPTYIIEFLNPAYKRNFIPENRKGHHLTLPTDAMAIFKDHFKIPDSKNSGIAGERISAPKVNKRPKRPSGQKMNYTVVHGDDLMVLARSFQCTEDDIMVWNRLASRSLRPGQKLVVYLSPENRKIVAPTTAMNKRSIEADLNESKDAQSWQPLALPVIKKGKKGRKKFPSFRWKKRDKGYVYHKLRRGESLRDVAERYEVNLADLQKLNELDGSKSLRTGTRLKVKKKR